MLFYFIFWHVSHLFCFEIEDLFPVFFVLYKITETSNDSFNRLLQKNFQTKYLILFCVPFRDKNLNANEIYFDFVSHIELYYICRNHCVLQRFTYDCKENKRKTLSEVVKNLAKRFNDVMEKLA